MQFPVSWLREFCNPSLNDNELAEVLTMGGMEVEEIHPVAPAFHGVVVAHVLTVAKHPDADRLNVCSVDVGSGEPLQIVCGAPNVRAGMRVPCAQVGAELPSSDGPGGKAFQIRIGKLRGVESFGMLCSAKELGIVDEDAGLLELPDDAPIGQNIRDFLGLDDSVLTLKLTPNLGHALSVYGVARELSALTGAPLQPLPSASIEVQQTQKVPVQIEAPELCGRFSGRVVSGITQNTATPLWMRLRLAHCGQRSVSPLVDISNYVMFERGQPTHIFDADCIAGGLHVRWAKKGEQLELLNGSTVTLDGDIGVIADDEKLESLAGIMGGAASAVDDATRNIYIEAAFWWPQSIAGRARRLNFSTDAGHRFERGVDPALTVAAIERITGLVQQICGGQAGPVGDDVARVPESKTLQLRVSRAAKVIGIPLSMEQCQTVLQRLDLQPQVQSADVLQVQVPSYRFDLNLEEDLIEEVVRLIGYNQLGQVAPRALLSGKAPSEQKKGPYTLRRQLAELGYLETINFSFVPDSWEQNLHGNADPIRLLNPIASQLNVMRSSLIGSLLQALEYNLDRKAAVVRIFELGRVFMRNQKVETTHQSIAGVEQPQRVAGLLYGDPDGLTWERKKRSANFYDAKADIEALLPEHAPIQWVAATDALEHPALHPGRSAQVLLSDKVIGFVGELHPKHVQEWGFVQSPIVFELDLQACLQAQLPQAQNIGKFPAVQRDIAVWLAKTTPYASVEQAIWQAKTDGFLRKVELFDVYPLQTQEELEPLDGRTQNEKSFAIRLSLASLEGTLTDAQIDAVVQSILTHLAQTIGARLRS